MRASCWKALPSSTRYLLAGAAFGSLFPLGARLLQTIHASGTVTLDLFLHAGRHVPVLISIIDTAPFFLGIFAWLAGRRQDALLTANRDLEQAMAAKREFLGRMSHELRTPLNAIIGLSEMTLQREEISDRCRERIRLVKQAGERLTGLIDDILSYNQLESGRLVMHMRDCEIGELVLSSVDNGIRALTEGAGLRLDLALSAEPLWSFVDPARLTEVLEQLVKNVLQHSTSEEIALRLGEERQERWLDVLDRGSGSAPEQSAITPGVGLDLCRSLMQRMGGRLEITQRRGGGTRVRLYLPEPLRAREGDDPADQLTESGVTASVYGSKSLPAVLVIDDDPLALRLLSEQFRDEPFRLLLASSAFDGIDLALRERPALIVLDMLMPGANGWSVLAALQSDARLQRVPVIVYSVLAEEERAQQFSMIRAWLSKPSGSEKLRALAREIVGQARGAASRTSAA